MLLVVGDGRGRKVIARMDNVVGVFPSSVVGGGGVFSPVD